MSERPAIANTAYNVMYINFTINGLASILTLALMGYMWKIGRIKLNLYTKCVLQMTFLQTLYDIFTPLYTVSITAVPFAEGAARGYSSTYLMTVTGTIVFCGVGSSFWSMMLLVSALFTVQYGRQPSYKEQIVSCVCVYLLLLGVAIPAAIVCHTAWYDVSRAQEHFAYWKYYDLVRIALIVLSVGVLLRLYQVLLRTSIKSERFRSPLFHLLKKIMWYPIILATARLGATSYKHIYNEDIAVIPPTAGGMQIFWMYVFVLLMPLTGIGCLLAFIHVTAGSKKSVIQMLRLECIFTVPDDPVPWLKEGKTKEHNLGTGEIELTTMSTSVNAEHERYLSMDEHDLASVVALHTRESRLEAYERE